MWTASVVSFILKNLLNLSNDKGLLSFFLKIYMLTIPRIDITDERIYHNWEVTFIYNVLEKYSFKIRFS